MNSFDNLVPPDKCRNKKNKKNISMLEIHQINKKILKQNKKHSRGKPKNLKKIKVNTPKLWATDQRNGRFLSPHLAGFAHQQDEKINISKEQQQLKIKQSKPLYEYIELFSIKYFGVPPNQNQKERLAVFFFRSSRIYAIKKEEYMHLDNQSDWNVLLKKIYFLFNPKFYQELQQILQDFFKGIDPSQIFDQILCFERMINASQILQVLFLRKLQDKAIDYKELEGKSQQAIEDRFKTEVNSPVSRVEGIEFLQEIYDLFYIQENRLYQQDELGNYKNQSNLDEEIYWQELLE